MSGPCLCGDPYCPNCGGADSALLDLEEAIGEALDIKTEAEGRYLLALIPAALAAFRDAREGERKEAKRAAAQEASEAALEAVDPWVDYDTDEDVDSGDLPHAGFEYETPDPAGSPDD